MSYEERAVFPQLKSHELSEEVNVALKQHAALRDATEELARAPADARLGAIVVHIARLMLHHTNFEGDYIYPELTHEQWRQLMKETVRPGT